MDNPSHYRLRDFDKALNADVVKKAAKSGGAPAWLKDFAGQLEDPDYARLTLAERGLLKDLRLLALRRGNKIVNDESYLRAQLRCSSRTRLVPKLHTLRVARFLEVHPDATEMPANGEKRSHPGLESGETKVRLEVEENVPTEQEKGSSRDRSVDVAEAPAPPPRQRDPRDTLAGSSRLQELLAEARAHTTPEATEADIPF